MSGGLMSGGLMSGGLMSGGLKFGGIMSGGLKSYDQREQPGYEEMTWTNTGGTRSGKLAFKLCTPVKY